MSNKELTGYPSIDKPWLKYYSDEAIKTPLPECTIFERIINCNADNLDRESTCSASRGRKMCGCPYR